MTDYALLLKENGLKATFQRMNILETIENHGHISIDTIYAKVIETHPSLSLATVYKNIILMVEKGVLVEVPITGKKSKYELIKEDHIHLVCTECGEVEDKPQHSDADTLFTSITEQENFNLSKQQINLYGVCYHCQVGIAS
jgi:Fur family ferric uptake transcriptional regulator/Fur family peroxide stress response transcriptional regulator